MQYSMTIIQTIMCSIYGAYKSDKENIIKKGNTMIVKRVSLYILSIVLMTAMTVPCISQASAAKVGVKEISRGGVSGAIKTDGSLWMWGYNAGGPLGKRTKKNRYIPLEVDMPELLRMTEASGCGAIIGMDN